MKTCPMCGTLLFDDAEKCTKCGNEMTEKPQEGTAEEAPNETQAGAADEGTEESPEEAQEPTQGAGEEPGTEETSEEDLSETSQQRKKWLEEQEKIKSELANIMGRVGTKKKPAFPPAPGVPAPAPGVAQNPAMTQVAPNPAAPGPLPQNNPQAVPQPTPNTNVQNFNPAPMDSNTGVGAAAVPAPAPAQAPVPTEEGLSEDDKTELMGELDDLRNEGYNVSKLERIIQENPGDAWKAFNDFLDDIETLNQLKSRLENCNTDGFPELEGEKNNLLSTMNDPDYMTQYEGNITQFENKLLSEKSKVPEEEKGEEDLAKKREGQLAKFIELGKEAFRIKNFEKALDMFTKADQLSPNNKEIVFFKKKVETKLTEQSGQVPGEAAAPGGAGEKKKKKKKKKKIVSRRSTPGAEAPGGAPLPADAGAAAIGAGDASPAAAPPPAGVPQDQQPAPPGAAPAQAVAAEPGAGAEGDEGEGPRTAAEFEALGFNAYINKDYPKALEFYEKVLQIDPNFPNVQNIINECLMRLGKK